MPTFESSEELVARTREALLAEILDQVNDVAAAAEVRDLAEALTLLAALSPSRPTGGTSDVDPDRVPAA